MGSYGAALRHISKHGMWGYVLLPGGLSLIIAGLIVWLAWGLSDNIGGFINNLWPWEWGSETVGNITQIFGGLIVAVLGAISIKQILMVLLAPVMSILSEKVENQLIGVEIDRPFTMKQIISDMVRGLRIAIRNIIRELLGTGVLLLLGLIPVLSPFTTALIFILQSYYAGFGNIDYTLERHFGYRDSIRFVRRNRGLAIGNGAVFMLLLFTCIGFFFALPLSTTAATIETVKRLDSTQNQGSI